jgi:hypothetical protein
MSLSVKRNHNYTISVVDSMQREIIFRDIKGSDLEYLDFLSKEEDGKIVLSFEQVISILSLLCVKNVDFKKLPQRISMQIFQHIKTQLLCNYMSKYDWLRRCYAMQNGSFYGILAMEEVPMNKFVAMSQIHQEAMDSIENPT